VIAQGILYACTYQPATGICAILSLRNGAFTTLHTIPIESPSGSVKLTVTEQDFWVGLSAGLLCRINRKDGTRRQYILPGGRDKQRSVRQLYATPGNDIWINCNGLYYWDARTDRFTRNPCMPVSWNNNMLSDWCLFTDLRGNLLVWYRNKDNLTSATLIDTQNHQFAYTPKDQDGADLLRDVPGKLMSNDFKQGFILFYTGLRFVEFISQNVIQKIPAFKHNRAMVQLDSQSIYSGRHGVLTLESGKWLSTGTRIFDHSHLSVADGDILSDSTGNIWVTEYLPQNSGKPCLLRYHPRGGTYDTIYTEVGVRRFDLLDETHVVFATKEHVYTQDTESGSTRRLTRQPFRSPVNQVFAGAAGTVWVATNKGLLKIDIRTGDQQWVDLAEGRISSVIRIHQDDRGRLWLGTMLNGLVVYDPASGSTRIIDQTSGLSNNTVVSLLEDKDGNIWAGTYHGINILSPEGVVIGKFYEEDGLADDECNRWSAMKMKDGRLCFGALDGLSIIDPALWKARMRAYSPPRIYLNELYSFSPEQSSAKIDLLPAFRQRERIALPAYNRSLNLAFVLANYSTPEKGMFAYLIEGIDQDWHYIGAQRQLSLDALPAGVYNILVKGSDGRGKWSDHLVIPVTVEAFFYQKWWFYILCAVPFIGFFILWQLRQQGERKRLEQEVQSRTATIQEQADKLLEADQMKSRLYTNITHEFRTPLTVISGMAAMIEKPETAKTLIQRNSYGLLHLVNQMLDLAKLESGHLALDCIQADVVPYIQYLLESFQSFAAGKNIKLVFSKNTGQLVMDFDEKKLESIISNLISNAIKFSNTGGLVELRLQAEPGHLQLLVIDAGIGIAPEKLPRVFDRFYQVDNSTTRKGEGTGIGLTLTKELVELMGGEISVQSPGPKHIGSVFRVRLPLSQNAPVGIPGAGYEPAPELDLSQTISHASTPQNTEVADLPLLLLIEDNTDVVIYIQACLQDRYIIERAENGAVGIDKALELIPDVIISDIMMPEKDGFEVCQTLKTDERTSHIPIILLTAKADVESRLEGLGVGADAYLSKPFLKEELFIRLAQLVELRRKLQVHYSRIADSRDPELAEKPVASSLDDLFIQKVYDLVLANLSDAAFGNVQLAQEMMLSESQLFRKLKALTGRSTALHIRSIRLAKGKEMLQNTDLTISEIAYESGFSSPFYFSSTFSKEFGMPPSALRK
ncbi:MAG: response regulator, partial [Bacteroidetes bacterium]